MKYKKLFTALLAAAAMLTACKQEKDYTLPEIKVSVPGLDFEAASSSSTVTVNATRDWKVSTEADWISISPDSGKANEEQTVTVTVLGNEGFNREAKLKFDITYDNRTVVLKQKGPAGSIEDAIVFYNNFDKEAATQTYGSGTSWPYLDQFDGWKNQTGTGVEAVSYGFNSISARNNSNSNGNYSDYEGSGLNNLLFGTDAYLRVSGIALGTGRNYTLSFGTEKYLQNSDNTFKPSEFHVYISADGQKWVELEYKFPGEFKDGRWDLASSTFTLPDGVTTLGIHVKSDLASGHRMDDLKLVYSLDPGTVIDFSTGIDIPTSGGGDTPSGDTSLAKIIAAANNTDVETAEVLVVAKYARGVMLQEGSDYLLVYDANGVNAKIGDKVVVKGKKATYSGQAQITTPTVTVKSSDNPVSYSEPKVLDASNFSTFTSNVPVYIQYVGTLVQSGNYLNVTIPGVEGKDGSIAYPAEDYSAFYNKEVKVTGFYLGGQTHYSTMVVKLEATDGSGGGDTPTETSLAKIIKAENNSDVETDEVLVVAKYARGVMLQEGSDYLLVYDANGVNAQIGDKVTVSGKKATYSGQAQITTPTVTVKSSGNTVTYPTVKVLDASNFASFTSNVPVYIQYKGTLVKSGNYLNVTIPGVEGKDGSIAYPAEDYSAFYDKEVTVTGFYLGGQTHYSTMVVKIEATDGSGGGSGGDTGTGQTFSTIAGLANDADVETNEVLVVGKHARGAMLQEGSAYMLAFDANGVNANVGDKVVVTGKKGTYSGMAQITSPSVTVKSTGNTVTYPTPKVLDATNFATYTATAPEYIQYTGKLVKSGNYLNVTIPGVEGKDGSIAYPIGSYDEFVDKNVTVSGFFVGGSTHYNTMAITVVEAGGSTGGDTGGGTGGDTGGGTGGDSGDSYASTLTWTLGTNASDAKVKVNGSATETAALKLGTSSKAGTATLTVPAGASKISFYGLGWKDKTATLTIKMTGMTDKQSECTANAGVSNNSPFTVTVAGTDKKTIDLGSVLGSAATVTVTTEGSTNTRVVLFGFVSE
ncbi:MAG: hypothetical protein IJ616_00680 [Bacteroidales bacterium]|nr:hypothetical protein [Bacteroidales bacterium]